MKGTKTKASKTKQQDKKRRISIITVVVVTILIFFDLSPFGGNARFYATWIGCGQKPVATAGSGLMNRGASHYYEPSSSPGMHPTINYYCTPLEAEQAGYSASPTQYEFPNLQQGT